MHAILAWAAEALIAFVALEHLGFMGLEMFVWNTRRGHKIFGLTPEFAAQSAKLAANQGLYNGFLAAGLIWSLTLGAAPEAFSLKVFFLICVTVAGIFGAATAKGSILFLQAAPALAGLALLFASR